MLEASEEDVVEGVGRREAGVDAKEVRETREMRT